MISRKGNSGMIFEKGENKGTWSSTINSPVRLKIFRSRLRTALPSSKRPIRKMSVSLIPN